MKQGSKEWLEFIGDLFIKESRDKLKADMPEGLMTIQISATLANEIGRQLLKAAEGMPNEEKI